LIILPINIPLSGTCQAAVRELLYMGKVPIRFLYFPYKVPVDLQNLIIFKKNQDDFKKENAQKSRRKSRFKGKPDRMLRQRLLKYFAAHKYSQIRWEIKPDASMR